MSSRRKWADANGHSFTEQSETGIPFYLKNPIWVDTHLTLKIASSDIFVRFHIATAKVVCLHINPSVGARKLKI